ncbi:MAG: tRNA lysidine(34) synthetase TilS [Clostridia bacterium]|nr:tRNA lysidine(34) synthetase TilS [Clostridia bacterium]
MINRVKNTFLQYGFISPDDEITVALSGGADSVCLLYILNDLKEEYGFKLSAFHLNHMLRGEEADRDEFFVKELCEKLGVPLTVERADIASEAKKRRESIELCARNIRYELLKKHAKGLVALAHTASDNLETVIYNLARGSGIKGLSGIPPKRDIFIRPLIGCTRQEVEDYLAKRKISFVTDSSNLTDDYKRNYIRHHIVPELLKLNPSAEATVFANSESLREDYDFISGMATKIYSIIAKGDHLDSELLCLQHPAVAKRVLAMLFFENCGATADNLHINRMYEALKEQKKVSLPRDMFADCDGKVFKIGKESSNLENPIFETEFVYENSGEEDKVYNLLLKNTVDCDKIKGELHIRCRNEGDSICLAGRGCTKSLKKLFNELKIPTEIRDYLPIVADDEGIVFIHSVGVAERVKVDRKTKNTVSFNVKRIDKN